MITTLSLMSRSKNNLNAYRNIQNQVTVNGLINKPQGGVIFIIGKNINEITPELHNALTQTNYNFNKINDDDILAFSKFLKDINSDPNTDRPSKRREFISTKLID